MAAYASLLSLEQTIHHYHDTYSLSPQEEQQIMSMNENVTLLKDFLECSPNKANNILEGQMRDLTNHVENIIGYFTWKTIRYGSINWIRRAKFKFELNKLATQIDSVAAEVLHRMKEARVDVDDDSHAAANLLSSSRRATVHKKYAMVGFDDDLLAIKERLCGESYNLQIVPLVGMGGIGKTTLATNAYHDPLIIEHFQIRAWVTVSQDYSAHKILSDLVSLIKELNSERSGQRNELNVNQT